MISLLSPVISKFQTIVFYGLNISKINFGLLPRYNTIEV
jgi:hypothetical protein